MKSATAADRNIELFSIASKMASKGLPHKFISDAVETAMEFEGVHDLMILWRDEEDQDERKEIVGDIQDMIDDCSQKEHREDAYIKFNDLEKIAADIRSFKDSLRLIVDAKGGIKELSRLTGIPQPSLSRFFGSKSMPRRVTLLKIARALKLDAIQIATEWTRD